MTVNTSLILANPDFDSIRGSLKAYLQAQDRFADYDFDGSNLSVILDILAYNSYQNAFTASMVASEMFLDTAQLKTSVVSHAKELGYTPRSVRSAHAIIDVTITTNDSPGAIVMPKGTMFTSAVGSRNFTFVTDRAHLIIPVNGVYKAANVDIYEGFALTDVFTVNNAVENQRFILSNPDIDTSTLTISVNGVTYTNATSILDVDDTSTVFFLQLNGSGRYEILFGDDVIGLQPVHQAVIRASYVVSSGTAANGCSAFTTAASIAGYVTISTATVQNATGGAISEGLESIRKNALQVYQTRDRAVTAEDYKVLLRQRFPELNGVNVYGGETVSPPQYGRVFISVSTDESLGITQAKANEYTQYIKDRTPLTIEPVFVDPDYLYLSVTSYVYYDYVNYTITRQDVEAAVSAAITDFSDTYLNDFNITFKYSQFTKAIDAADPSILSNETTIKMSKVVDTVVLPDQTQTLSFYNAFNTDVGRSIVTSTRFDYNDQICMLTDDQQGNLQIVTNLQNDVPTMVTTIGTVDYENGEISISPFTTNTIYGSTLIVSVEPATQNISAYNNTIMVFDTTNNFNISGIASR